MLSLLLLALAPQDAAPPVAEEVPAAAVDWASSGLRYQDAKRAAALWGLPVEQAQEKMLEMVNRGQRQELERLLEDLQAQDPALAQQAFDSSAHDLCDAKTLAEFWGETLQGAQERMGNKLIAGSGSYLLDQLEEAQSDSAPEPCTFAELKYGPADAALLAGLWGISTAESKARMVHKVNLGERAVLEAILWDANNPPAPFPARTPWVHGPANAALRTAAACIHDPTLGQPSGPAPACIALQAASAGLLRGPEHGIKDGQMHAEIKLAQPDQSWITLEEFDGNYHGFLWVQDAGMYLGYASWYGEYGCYLILMPGSHEAVKVTGVPVFSPDGKLLAAAQNDPFGDDGFELVVLDLSGSQATDLLRTAYTPAHHVGHVQGLSFVGPHWIQIDMDTGPETVPLWVDRRTETLQSAQTVYASSGLSPCDAKVLAELWKLPVHDTQMRVGSTLIQGKEAQVSTELARAFAAPHAACTWEETALAYEDMELLAALWGTPMEETKARAVAQVSQGRKAHLMAEIQAAKPPASGTP